MTVVNSLNLIGLIDASEYLELYPRTTLSCIKYGANSLKLVCHDISGETFFKKNDLDKFKNELLKPWVDQAQKRPAIPVSFREQVEFESGSRCAICNSYYNPEVAHIVPWEKCLHHYPSNLLFLCSKCHGGHDRERRIHLDILIQKKSANEKTFYNNKKRD